VSKPVFISYAKDDKNWAEQVCAQLEEAGIGCWIAPRDIAPGVTWPAAITEAIRQCRAMIIIFSGHANQSPHMAREVEVADSRHVPIIPVRVEEIEPAGDMEYFLGNRQWFDLNRGMLERRIAGLPEAISALIAGAEGGPPVAAVPRKNQPKGGGRRWWYVAIAGVIVAAAILVFAWPTRTKPASSTAQASRAVDTRPAPSASDAPQIPAKSPEPPSAKSQEVKSPARPVERSLKAATPLPSSTAKADPPAPVAAVVPGSDASTGFGGRWQAAVKYSWGDSHTEVFSFKVDQNEVYGTASYVGGARGILDGKIEGNRISFTTKSMTMLGDKTYEEKHFYKGHLTGDTIDFILQTESGYDSRAPEMFTANRTAASKP
jgi:TIR domain-containing protein